VRARNFFFEKYSVLKAATSETVQVLSEIVIRCNRLIKRRENAITRKRTL